MTAAFDHCHGWLPSAAHLHRCSSYSSASRQGHAGAPLARYLTRLIPFALGACSSCTDARSINEFHEVGRFHTPNMHSLYPSVTHFVVAAESLMYQRNAVLAYSRRTCTDEDQICSVLYWTEESKAASGFPITDREVDAIVASYNRNRSTGNDGFQCYSFGSPAERCKKSD
jgi:hypothetical protein